MKKTLIAISLVGVFACGDDSPTTPAAPTPTPLPNYTGIWQGTYTITSCVQNGTITLANVCGQFAPGTNLNFQLNIIQQGAQIIQGTFTLGTLPFAVVPATLTSAGTVSFSGTAALDTLTILVTWNLQTPITGTLSHVWSSAGLTGQVNIQANIGAVVKTGSVEAVRLSAPRSLHEAVDAVTR